MGSRTVGRPQVEDEAPTIPNSWRIDFVGPIPAHKWPSPYELWFGPIREIGRTYFDLYTGVSSSDAPSDSTSPPWSRLPANLVPNDSNVAKKKNQVRDLNQRAFICRKERRNEAGWRFEVETTIFDRFHAEVVCENCRNHLWQSDWQALPTDPVEASQLQRLRARRRQCTCDGSDRADFDNTDAGNSAMFIAKRETLVVHDAPGTIPKGIRRARKPDLVYGLGMTRSFDVYTRLRQDIQNSPFKDSGVPCLYPFLVVEAKSEWHGPGFDSIERQLALPLRTCLSLQKDLNLLPGVELPPLVWSIAFRGDEWRLYAAVPDGERTRVVDLWHGNILSEDGALQLFLIIDYLCNWARDIFRKGVLKCLAGGAANLRHYTPAASQDGHSISRRSTALSVLSIQSEDTETMEDVPGSRPTGAEEMDVDIQSRTQTDTRSTTTDRSITMHLQDQSLQRIARLDHPALGSASRIVRNCVQVRIPKDHERLRQFLRKVLPHIEVRRAAQLILDNFVNDARAVTTDSEGVLSSDIARSLGYGDTETQDYAQIRHYFTCKSEVNPLYGGILHKYLCVSCSQDAAVELAIIAQADGATIRAPRHWKSANITKLEDIFRQLESVGPRALAKMALEGQTIMLATAVDDGDPLAVSWQILPQINGLTRLLEQAIDGLTLEQMSAVFGDSYIKRASTIVAQEAASNCAGLRELVDTSNLDHVPGVLVVGEHRPLSEGTSSCFFVFDDSFMGEGAFTLLQATREANAVYEQDARGSWVVMSDAMES